MWHNRYVDRYFIRALILLFVDRYTCLYACSWFAIRISRCIGKPIPFINNYLTDFVFTPLILHFTSILGLYLFKSYFPLRFPLWQILFLSTYVSIIFEWLAPKYTSYNVGDWGDVIAYFAGGLFYHYIHNIYFCKKVIKIKNLQIYKSIRTNRFF